MFKYNLFVCIYLLVTIQGQCQNRELFRNENASEHDRIQNLLSVLTIDEKIGLLRATSPAIPRLGIEKYHHGMHSLNLTIITLY